MVNRNERTAAAMSSLHQGLVLLALTGVEDRLADSVPETLGMLRAAGVKVKATLLTNVLCLWYLFEYLLIRTCHCFVGNRSRSVGKYFFHLRRWPQNGDVLSNIHTKCIKAT